MPIRLVRRAEGESLFNYLINQYHYLGFSRPVGEHLKYLVLWGDRPVGRSNALAVFDAETREELERIPLLGLNPRALAVSPDGGKVYVAFALSGNRTTIIPRKNAPDQPSPTNLPDAPPKVALIVDAEDPAWADEIQYTMPDNDVAEIDTDSLAVTRYFTRLGTVNLGLGVHPQGGDLWVANTDARNRVFFEPALATRGCGSRPRARPGGAGLRNTYSRLRREMPFCSDKKMACIFATNCSIYDT